VMVFARTMQSAAPPCGSTPPLQVVSTFGSIVPEDVIGKHVFEFTAPEAKGKVQEALDKVFTEGKSHAYETQAVGPHGTMLWYDTRVGPVKIRDEVTAAARELAPCNPPDLQRRQQRLAVPSNRGNWNLVQLRTR